MTIPTQDLTGLDLLMRNSRFGDNGNDTSGSMFTFPSSSSRHRQHHQLQEVVRTSRRALGDGDDAPLSPAVAAAVAAAASSAFTSAESFPVIPAAEDGPSSNVGVDAVAPARPQDHPGTKPALSRLLVPPFDNEALRGDFIASLEQHLAAYEDGGGRDDGGGVRLRDGSGRTGDDGGNDGGSAGSSRAVAVGLSRQASEADSTARTSGGPAVAVSGGKVPGRKGEQEKTSVFAERTGVDEPEGGGKSSNWAQEYHDYLCSKE